MPRDENQPLSTWKLLALAVLVPLAAVTIIVGGAALLIAAWRG